MSYLMLSITFHFDISNDYNRNFNKSINFG